MREAEGVGNMDSVGPKGLGRMAARDQQHPVPSEKPGFGELGAGSPRSPAQESPLSWLKQPLAFIAIIQGSHCCQGDGALFSVSPKTEMRVTGIYSELSSLLKHFHIHYLIDSHHSPVKYSCTAEETEALKG